VVGDGIGTTSIGSWRFSPQHGRKHMQYPARVTAPTKHIIIFNTCDSTAGGAMRAKWARSLCRCALSTPQGGVAGAAGNWTLGGTEPCKPAIIKRNGRNHGTDADAYTLAALPSFIHYSTHPLLLLASSAHRVAVLAYSLQIPRCRLT
jgi:hypothetical protein